MKITKYLIENSQKLVIVNGLGVNTKQTDNIHKKTTKKDPNGKELFGDQNRGKIPAYH